MVYLAVVCAVIAILLVTASFALLTLQLVQFFKPVSERSVQSLAGRGRQGPQLVFPQKDHSIIKKLTALLGEPLQPFVTWSQRRRLSVQIDRAGLVGWYFYQIYCLQCAVSLTAFLIGAWFLQSALLSFKISAYLGLMLIGTMAWWLPVIWLKRAHLHRLKQISRQLPFFLDMVGLGLDAGLNLQSAVQLALEHVGEGALHQEWSKMLADLRAGQSRAQALRQLSQRLDLASLRQLISSLIQGEAMGFSLSRIIQVYADQQRAQRLMLAEKQAIQAPVKMLFPMALCIFPCTFIVLGFPVVVQLMGLS